MRDASERARDSAEQRRSRPRRVSARPPPWRPFGLTQAVDALEGGAQHGTAVRVCADHVDGIREGDELRRWQIPRIGGLGVDHVLEPQARPPIAPEDLLDGAGVETVVHQCGSGVSACHNILAMEVAGLAGTRLYPGSWSEWCADPARPVSIGK